MKVEQVKTFLEGRLLDANSVYTDRPELKIPRSLRREKPLRIPTEPEGEVARHYTWLSTLNFGVDSGFYPLGSCTMKYNQKILEKVTWFDAFQQSHPYQDQEDVQGILRILYELETRLCELLGYAGFTFQPAAGAHGEHTGLLIIRAFLEDQGEMDRKVVLIPDSAHGTNPASAVMAGFTVKKVPSDSDGNVDLEALKKALGKEKVACLMLTNPSTLGLFEPHILTIAKIMHEHGGLLYYDGANANALVGLVRPGDLGFDVCHINLHKSFGTPHGGGGPGSGPVGVSERLKPFLPEPRVIKAGSKFELIQGSEKSIGAVHGFMGNSAVWLKALAYIMRLGNDGFTQLSRQAILNANYLQGKLKDSFQIPYLRPCMHEFVLSVSNLKKAHGISALDIAKRLIDYGMHPPTIYFPLIVSECLMIEPTETETLATLDHFVDVMKTIKEEAETDPDLLHNAPSRTIIQRLDEARAVKQPKLTFFDEAPEK